MTPAQKIIKSNNELIAVLQGLAKDMKELNDPNKW